MAAKNIRKCAPAESSQISKALDNAYFYDAYRFNTQCPERTALQVWLTHATTTPAWFDFLMGTRNKIVSLLGLKNLGDFAPHLSQKSWDEYQVGDKIGIFTLLYLSDNEVILGDSDKHLDVKVSVYKGDIDPDVITISTLVHVHNLLGKAYMLVVTPLHKIIVPATIKRAEFSH